MKKEEKIEKKEENIFLQHRDEMVTAPKFCNIINSTFLYNVNKLVSSKTLT
jgi:hypothetical protein